MLRGRNPTLWVLAALWAGSLHPARAQTEYTADGLPTALEEEVRWHVNRGRFDSARENTARGTTYTDVPASSGPLAPNESIARAARHHSEDMAKNNAFQHETVTGSAYYNPDTQPQPWDRMRAEGYDWTRAGENIAAGYGSAEQAYVGWWKSAGHRLNMYNTAFREIGDGYFNWTASTYRHYYTMDLGTSGANCFFTDTLFFDTNTDGTYDQTEGVGGVRIDLRYGGGQHTAFDVSSAVGSFAVPIRSIAAGTTVEVWLLNQNTTTVQVSVPRNYTTLEAVALPPAQARLVGSVVQPSGALNLGFRQITPPPPPITPPALTLSRVGNEARLSWPSEVGLEYRPQSTSDFATWADLGSGYQTGTGGEMTFSDNVATSTHHFYRLVVRRP